MDEADPEEAQQRLDMEGAARCGGLELPGAKRALLHAHKVVAEPACVGRAVELLRDERRELVCVRGRRGRGPGTGGL
jgi:hypothetical protein